MLETNTITDNVELSRLLQAVGKTQDMAAFEALFRHFAPRLKAYMARGGNSAGAEELMQETMLAVWRKAALYDPAKGGAAAWIFSVARNQRIDAYRRDRRPELDPNDPMLAIDEAPSADLALMDEEDAERVQAALTELPEEQAEVLKLAFFADQSQSEIASRLKLPLGTVKSRMRLAFAKLRTVLSPEGERA